MPQASGTQSPGSLRKGDRRLWPTFQQDAPSHSESLSPVLPSFPGRQTEDFSKSQKQLKVIELGLGKHGHFLEAGSHIAQASLEFSGLEDDLELRFFTHHLVAHTPPPPSSFLQNPVSLAVSGAGGRVLLESVLVPTGPNRWKPIATGLYILT